MNYILAMIIGHFVGDFLGQNSAQASNKNKPGLKGWVWALYHGATYTTLVVLTMIYFYPGLKSEPLKVFIFLLFTWVTHSTIDHYSLGKKWSKFMKSDTLPDFTDSKISKDKNMRTEAEIYKISFTSVVYIVVDNTWHIVLQSAALVTLFGRTL